VTNRNHKIDNIVGLLLRIQDDMPAFLAHMRAERVLADGYADHVTYAVEPTTSERTSPISGTCRHNVIEGEVLVDCGRERPCADHDTPVPLTPTERAAAIGMRIDDDLECVRGEIEMIGRLTAGVYGTMNRLIGKRYVPPKRCDAQGRQGSIEWWDADCTLVPSRGPLCEKHSQREYRWRIRNGLPKRTDGVFSQDGVGVA
jgi:hypothetical protein